MENSAFVSDAELLDMINEAYAALYDLIVSAFQHYYTSTDTITLVAGTASYALPDDFYKLIGVDLQEGAGTWKTLFPYNEVERNSTINTTSSIPNATARLRYIPAPAVFTDDDETIDGVAGWEALLVTDVAIMMLEKEESDTTALERRRMRDQARIQQMAQNRDVSMPGTVTDVNAYNSQYAADQLRYRFYGDNLEFINVEYMGV